MKASGWRVVVGVMGAMCAAGCFGDESDDHEENLGVDIQAIKGGAPASAYPSAALLNMRTARGGGAACSAAVIAPKVVLTAGHCVDGMVSWEVLVGGSKRVSTRGETFDWNENGATVVNPNHHDIGLVYLNEALTLPSYPTLAAARVAEKTPAVNVGRVLDGTVTNSLYFAPVTLRDASSFGYVFDYYAAEVIEHGDSGGPVFLTGTQTIVAVNSGAGGGTEVLARVDLLRAWIQQRIEAQSAPAPAPTPTPAPAPTPTPPASTPPAQPSCANEVEPNDTVATAMSAPSALCGSLRSASDVDWFTLTVPVGKTRVSISAAGDASFAIGFPTNGTCTKAASNVREVQVSAAGAPGKLCLAVSSAARVVQSYRLTTTR